MNTVCSHYDVSIKADELLINAAIPILLITNVNNIYNGNTETMELRDIDLNLLVIFHQLLIDRKVSTAAESLGMTQPAVSNALKRLRLTLQDELFVRTYSGMEPTPYAQRLAKPITQAIDSIHNVLNQADGFDAQTSERSFTLAMTDIGEIHFIPQLMEALAKVAPRIRINTVRDTPQLGEDLQNGMVDLAIGWLPHLQAGFFQRGLFHHHYVCMSRHNHPITQVPLTLERFCAYGHIRIAAANTGHGAIDTLMARAGIQRSIRLEVPHFLAIGHILQHSDLLATVPQRFAAHCAAPFGLSATPLPMNLPQIAINLFWHAKYHQDPANRWLRQLLFELFAD